MNTKIYVPIFKILVVLSVILLLIELIGFKTYLLSLGFFLFVSIYGILLANRIFTMKAIKKFEFEESKVINEKLFESPKLSKKSRLLEIFAIIIAISGYISLFF